MLDKKWYEPLYMPTWWFWTSAGLAGIIFVWTIFFVVKLLLS